MKQYRFSIGLLMLMALFIIQCNSKKNSLAESPVARVGDQYLYPADMAGIFNTKLSSQDSLQIRQKFIEKWVKKQLLLQKAELNLNADQKDVRSQLDDYRASLLIYKYEEMLLKQQMDTSVSESEMEKFYNQNGNNFVLNQPALKGVFVKIPADSPNQDKLRRWYKSENPDDLHELESYCYQYAKKNDYFNDEWTYLESILKQLPLKTSNPEQYIRYSHYIEFQDSVYSYYLNVKEFRASGSVAPLSLVSEDIKSIILNKRKMEFLQHLENDIYSSAYNRDKFETY
jgi:hypothetical protein